MLTSYSVSAVLAGGAGVLALNGQSAWVWAWFLLAAVLPR
jgi:hypothetical protein